MCPLFYFLLFTFTSMNPSSTCHGIFKIFPNWKANMLSWAEENFPYFCYFNPNGVVYPQGTFPHKLFAGNHACSIEEIDLLPTGLPKIGIIGYDQKNRYEKLKSQHPHWVECPDSLFFSPLLTIEISEEEVVIQGENPSKVWEEIVAFQPSKRKPGANYTLQASHSKSQYKAVFEKIQTHIKQGDVYEMNFCLGYQGTFESFDPLTLYLDLCAISPMPFSAYFKAEKLALLCSSPERFLKKTGNQLITQPIKGSTRRGGSPKEDTALKTALAESEKEKAENLMIVDLMRNDLSRLAQVGKVEVDELFGIYSFRQITQMISSVSCTLKPGLTFEDIISKTFPMGSMTGAPKIKCMELIDHYESFRRSWFSGTLGYIDPSGDFDFCVVIRSLILDSLTNRFYFGVGSAITSDANFSDEYNECQLKAASMIRAIKNQNSK